MEEQTKDEMDLNQQMDVCTISFTPQLEKNVHSLKISDKNNFEICVLKTIFQKVPQLKNLELINVHLLPNTTQNKPVIKLLPQITSLVFIACDFQILSIISPCNVTDLRISSTSFKPNEHLIEFLAGCSLSSLDIHGIENCDINEFFKINISPFKLRSLKISSTTHSQEACLYNAEALLFFTRNTALLESCCIRAQLPWDSLNFVLKKLPLLKSLTLNLSLLPSIEDFYVTANPLKNVKTLILEGPHIDIAQIEAIFKLYTSINSLTLDNFSTDLFTNHMTNVLEMAANHCLLLSELSISRLPSLPWHIGFRALTSLRVKYVNKVDEIVSIFYNSKKLRSLRIDFVLRKQFDQESIDRLLLCNLTHLYFTAEPFECLQMLEMIIASEDKNLEFVELRTESTFQALNKTYSIRFKKKGKHKVNYKQQLEQLRFEVGDLLLNELMASISDNDEDSKIIDFVLDSN